MSIDYLQVAEEENEQPIELPLERDGTMLLTTVKGVYPGACGIKFRNPETNTQRGVRLVDGSLHPPTGGWNGSTIYLCVFPLKRKMEVEEEPEERGSAKTKRLEKKLACTDLICLGLPWKCTEASVKEHFEQFGEVVMMQLKRDSAGKFKGFGFIRFDSYASQMRALGQRHNIDGRWVDVCIPYSKGGVVPQVSSKVFVGRCTEDITAEDLRTYFSEFGEVIDVFVPRPFRAFAFVTFLDPEVAQGLCGEDHVIKGASVSVSSAEPKPRQRSKPGQGVSGSRGGGNQSWNNANFDSLNMQNLGIHPNITPDTNVTVPMRLVAAALNAELMGGNGGRPQRGGQQGWNQGWNGNGGRYQGGGGGHQGGSWPQQGSANQWQNDGRV